MLIGTDIKQMFNYGRLYVYSDQTFAPVNYNKVEQSAVISERVG